MKRDGTPDRLNEASHRHYTEWFIADGVKTEFFLSHRVVRLEDIAVYVNGNRYKPDINGTAHDFKIRGITPGYPGDQNAIKFASAPIATMDVCVDIIST